MSQPYDRFLVAVGIGTNRKLRRLPVAQRWTYVAGVLALAAQSPMRGSLLITDGEPATAEDIAEEATVPVKDARAALDSLRRLGMLQRDEHGVEWVHDWDRLNPDPRPSDSPEATRERKRRQRERSRAEGGSRTSHDEVTRDVTAAPTNGHDPQGKGSKDSPPPFIPPQAGDCVCPVPPVKNRQTDKARYQRDVESWVAAHFPTAHPSKVTALAEHLRRLGQEPTADAMRAFSRFNPVWTLEEAAA